MQTQKPPENTIFGYFWPAFENSCTFQNFWHFGPKNFGPARLCEAGPNFISADPQLEAVGWKRRWLAESPITGGGSLRAEENLDNEQK